MLRTRSLHCARYAPQTRRPVRSIIGAACPVVEIHLLPFLVSTCLVDAQPRSVVPPRASSSVWKVVSDKKFPPFTGPGRNVERNL